MDLWTGRPGAEVVARGERHDRAQHTAALAYDTVVAPPCPSCGRPVRDEEWARHRHEAHGHAGGGQPWGRAESREVLLVDDDREGLERRIAAWRERHPGLRLVAAADGRDRDLGVVWARFRVTTRTGRPVGG